MGDVKINDLNLLRYCHTKMGGSLTDELKESFPTEKCVCFGEYRDDGEPLWAASLYDFKNNHECNLDMTLNHKGIMSPSLFKRIGRVLCDYIFNQAKLKRCNSSIRISNHASIKLTKAYGFQIEGIKRHGFVASKAEDMVLLGLLKDECRWI